MEITGLLIDTERETAVPYKVEDTLDAYYEALHCDMIEIARRRIGRKVFTIICDEEGTFKDDPKISAIDNLGRPMFIGSLFICNEVRGEDDTYLTSLTPKETEYILNRVEELSTSLHPKAYPILTQCEYDI